MTIGKEVVEVLGELVGEVSAAVTDRVVSYELATIAQGMFMDEMVGMIRAAESQPRFPGENYITPDVALQNTGKLLAFAAKLSAISPELGEVVTEGISEDLMVALQHVTTEPLERLFSVVYGAENIDSDDLTEAYAWGLMPPEMLAWLLAVDGLSNSAALAAASKALGEKYSGDFRAVEDAVGSLSARALTMTLDPVEKLYSEARSALFGVPEAARTHFNEYVAEVNRLYTAALRRALDALAYMRAAELVGEAKLQQSYLVRAEQRYAEAQAYLEAADRLAEYLARFENALAPVLRDVVEEAVRVYDEAWTVYAAWLRDALGSAARLAADVQAELKAEMDRVISSLARIRGTKIPVVEAPPGSVSEKPRAEVEWVG